MRSALLIPAALAVMSLPSWADNYYTELNVGHDSYNGSSNEETWQYGVTQYFQAVSTDNGPYALNGFLSRTGYVSFNVDKSDALDVYKGSSRLVNSDNWVVGIGAEEDRPDDETHSRSYYLEGGRYLDDSTLLTGYYHRLNGGPVSADTFGITFSRYLSAGTSGLWVTSDISRINGSGGYDAFVAKGEAAFFFTNSWSVGAGMTFVDTDDREMVELVKGIDKTQYEVGTSYWFAPQAKVSFTSSISDGEGAAWHIKIGYRF
ncbi:hypothetical protein [Gallaecimonas mangrovi]|uniref:hypothetical protein n=1 Tax=Gallaecimonas mangrovi TaxID=2291597 RepID=UPI001260144B|nr:hypothetical protein [Gallaecimonas mangrovi]